MKHKALELAAITACFVALAGIAAGAAVDRPVAVSPGAPEANPIVADRCPTFNWGSVDGATAYELAVYRLPREGEEAETPPEAVIRTTLPGSAHGWTPDLTLCLERGAGYAWTLRAHGPDDVGEWSEASFFRVAAAPSVAEVEQALVVLRSYLAAAGEAAGQPPRGLPSPPDGARRTDGPQPSLALSPDTTAITGENADTAGVGFGVHGISNSTGGGSAGAVGQSTAAVGDVAGVVGQVASPAGTAGVFDNTAGGDVLRGLVDGVEIFRVAGTGQVTATGFSGDGSGLTDVTPAPHSHAGEDVTSGTVAESRIDAAIARDSEILPSVLAGDGAGSTLDADLLDGNHASAFLPAGTDNWVDEAGDTMTGTLQLPADGLVAGTDQLVLAGGNVGIGVPVPGEKLEVAGNVKATQLIGDGSLLTNLPVGGANDLGCTGCVSVPELDFDPATQSELDVHTHAGEDITSGTVAESRIDAAIARDSEILPAVLAGDGAGSTLDADLLDGNDASAFLPAGTDNWVNVTGDTMTGTLTLNPTTGNSLEVQADLNLVSADILKGGAPFIHDNGTGNTALGAQALSNLSSGYENVAVGREALRFNTTGGWNVAIGDRALLNNGAGTSNVAVGRWALHSNNSSQNTAVGFSALERNQSGGLNTAVGSLTLWVNTSGSSNTAVGATALRSNTVGELNTAIGAQAMDNAASGEANTAVGAGALGGTTVGSRNVAIGISAGIADVGDDNIFIANLGVSGDANTLRIGTQGTQTKAFVAGISNTTLSGNPVVVDAYGQLGVSSGGSGGNADTLDGLDSTDFLRSNTSDSFTTGTLTTAAGTTLDVDGALDASGAASVTLPAAGITGAGAGSGLNADLLDGNDSSAFLSASADHWVNETGDTMSGTLTLSPTSGKALVTTTDIDLGGDILKSGTLFIHSRNVASNTAVGANALSGITSGGGNTALGSQALSATTSGSSNTAAGQRALWFNTTGHHNVAVGNDVLYSNTTGFNNTASGWEALHRNVDGERNTAMGDGALRNNTSGNANTAVGTSTLFLNTTGGYNIAMGDKTLFKNSSGSRNTAFGDFALYQNQTGWRNVAVGNRAGLWSTGSDNVLLSHEGVAAESGTIRIGTQGTHTRAFIAGIRGVTTGTADAVTVLIDSQGQLGTVSSSQRYKEDIRDMADASRRILKLRPVLFRYKEASASGERPLRYGLIAEEVAEVFPELVAYDEEGRPETVLYHLLGPMLLNELQRQELRLQEQDRRLAEQEQELRRLTAQVAALRTSP